MNKFLLSIVGSLLLATLLPCSQAAQVNLQWTQSVSPNVASQRVYRSSAPVDPATGRFSNPIIIPIGNVSAYTVPNLANGTYFFAVTALDAAQIESLYSNVISTTVVAGTPTPSPTPTPTPPPSVFAKAINVGGAAATINGRAWFSQTAAASAGFATASPAYSSSVSFLPAVDAQTSAMLNTGVWRQSGNVEFSQTTANGKYYIYIWTTETHADNFRSFDIVIEGVQVATAVGRIPNNTWRRLGPYVVTLTDGTINVKLVRVTGDAVLNGVEIWKAIPAAPTSLKVP